MELYLLAKIQIKSLTHYWDIKNLLFRHTLGLLERAWPRPSKIQQLICSSQGILFVCKKSKQMLKTNAEILTFLIFQNRGGTYYSTEHQETTGSEPKWAETAPKQAETIRKDPERDETIYFWCDTIQNQPFNKSTACI